MTNSKKNTEVIEYSQEELHTRERFLALLADITRVALETPNFQDMLQILADRMAELFEADGCYITLWNKNHQSAELVAAFGPLGKSTSSSQLLTSEKVTVTHTVLDTEQVLAIEDVTDTRFADLRILKLTSDRGVLGLPLIAGDQKLGAVIITFRKPRKFTAQEIKRGKQAARQIALAFAKARLIETEREQRLLAETLRDVTLAFTSKTEPAAVLDEILNQAQRLIDFKTASITLLENETLRVVRSRGYQAVGSAAFISSLVQQLSELPLDSKVVETREPLVIDDVLKEPHWVMLDETAWIRSVLMVPIWWADRVLGILRFDSQTPGTFSTNDAKRLQPLANAAAIALENARLHNQIQRHAAELEQRVAERTVQLEEYSRRQAALAQFELAINLPQELESVLNRAAEMTETLLPASGGAGVILWDAQTEDFNLASASNLLLERLPTVSHQIQNQEPKLWWIIEQRKPLIITDTQKDTSNNAKLIETGVLAYAGVPLLAPGEILGVLYATDTQPKVYTQDDLDFMVALANRVSVAITKVRLYEQLAEAKDAAETASRAKSEFLANMSHELRTPLSAIIGFAEVLSEQNFGPLTDKQGKYINNIIISARRLLQLINDLLDLAKAEAGRMSLNMMPFNALEAIHSVASELKEETAEKDQSLDINIEPSLPLITADLPKFRKILQNLLSNAIKYTSKGGQITIIAQVKDSSQLGDTAQVKSRSPLSDTYDSCQFLCISVADTGIGLSQADRDRIFGVFEQLDAAYNRQQPGTGLGLALTQRLIGLQGGYIWVESEGRGKGSTFTVALPLHDTTKAKQISPQPTTGNSE